MGVGGTAENNGILGAGVAEGLGDGGIGVLVNVGVAVFVGAGELVGLDVNVNVNVGVIEGVKVNVGVLVFEVGADSNAPMSQRKFWLRMKPGPR